MTTEPLDPKRHSVERFAEGDVVDYYALVAGQVERDQATSSVRAGTSKHFPIPVCLVARLAVDRESQGRGLGAGLLLDALRRAVGAAELVGIRAVVVHALDDEAAAFYEHYSFAPLGDEPRTLMAPLAAVRAVLSNAR